MALATWLRQFTHVRDVSERCHDDGTGVRLRLWMHWKALKPQIDEAFRTYEEWGIEGVMVDFMDRDRDVVPPVQGTRGHQLAMYVVYQNHLPRMADYPQAYRNQPGLEFLTQVPANWDETRALHAKQGDCLVVARRKGSTWYFGGMTAAKQQELNLPLDFLGEGSFDAEPYLDDPDAGPASVTCRKQTVSSTGSLWVVMPRAGGFAARLVKSVR